MLKIQSQCICPVCIEILQDPIILSCSHNICLQCVMELLSVNYLKERDSRMLNCPVCRRVTVLASLDPELLPRNLALSNIIKEYQVSGKPSEWVCQLCRENPSAASVECLACELVACDSCAEAHLSKPRFMHHKMLPISQSSQSVCADHRIEKDLFCVTDKALCCIKCAQFSSAHKNHEILTKKEAKVQLTSEIISSKNFLPLLVEKVKSSKQALSDQLEELTQKEQTKLSGIQATFQELKSVLNEAQAAASANLNSEYEKAKESVLGRISTLSQIEEKTKLLQQTSDELELLQQAQELKDLNPMLAVSAMPEISATPQKKSQVESMLESLYHIEITNPYIIESNLLWYCSRGTKDYLFFDFSEHKFTLRKLDNQSLIPRWSGCCMLPDSTILVTGGKRDKDSGSMITCFYFDTNTGVTRPCPDMIFGHSSHVCLFVSDRVYCISGKNPSNHTHNACEYFDLNNETWHQIAPINLARTCASGSYLKGNIYVLGGYQTSVSNTCEKYSIETDSWVVLSITLPERIWQHGSYPIGGDQILVFGGECTSDEPHRLSYIFNTETQEFSNCASIPINNTWLFFWLNVVRRGPYLYTMNKEKNILKYDISRNTWSRYET